MAALCTLGTWRCLLLYRHVWRQGGGETLRADEPSILIEKRREIMLTEKRQEEILKLLEEKGSVTLQELKDYLIFLNLQYEGILMLWTRKEP